MLVHSQSQDYICLQETFVNLRSWLHTCHRYSCKLPLEPDRYVICMKVKLFFDCGV